MDKPREVALKILYRIDQEKAYSNLALDEEINKNKDKLTPRDVGFISEIVYGVTTWRLTLDEIIQKYSKMKLKKISPWILNILRMGIYQKIFLTRVPDSAAVNESVQLAKRYGHKASANFVNAVLRKVKQEDYKDLFEISDPLERISKTMSIPVWIVKELLKDRTIEQVEKVCNNLNKRPNLTIRINRLKTTKQELEEELEKRDILYQETELPDFLILKNAKNIENIDLFKNGFFTVQDMSAGLAALVLEPKKGEKVLDACSAPGGKTTYLAEIMENEGEILALELHLKRAKLVEENSKRLGVNIIRVEEQDATCYQEKWKEKFDKILLDVPCMGIGVIKRKPDIKWQRTPEDICTITEIQEKILNVCAKYLKNGGELVYSTCSILKEENEEQILKFVKKNEEFEIEKIELNGKKNSFQIFQKYVNNGGMLQIEPGIENDGFFIAKLIKK